MKHLFTGSLLSTALLPLLMSTPAQPQENTNRAHVRPVLTAPLMQAPVIDGVIGDGEWNTLHAGRFVSQKGDLLSERPGGFWIGSDGKHLFIAVRTAVHPTRGILDKHEPRGAVDLSEVIYDDSIELWIDNDPNSKREDGHYYQIMVNARGALYDASFTKRDQIAQKFFRVGMQQAHGVKDGLWTGEFSIPLTEIGIKNLDNPLGIRIARNWKLPWDQSRSEPNVHGFDSSNTMSTLRFVNDAPIVKEVNWQDEKGIALAVEVTNPHSKPLPLKVKLGYNAQDQPRYYENWNEPLQPGETKQFTYRKDFFTPESYPAIGEVLVTDADGKALFHRDFRWMTKSDTTKIWDAAATAEPDATQFRIAYYPSYGVLRWQTDFDVLKERDKIQAARVEVWREGGSTPVVQSTLKIFKNYAGEAQLDLPALPDGNYQARFFLQGQSGDAAKPLKTIPFQHRSFAWQNNRIGVGPQVVEPFDPIEVKQNVVSTTLRRHTVSGEGLWLQVRAKDEPLLAGPMRLEARHGAHTTAVQGVVRTTQNEPHRVVTRAAWGSPGRPFEGRTNSEWDYDGVMKVTLELPATGAQVDGLDLVIPLRDELFPLMHACGEGLRSNYAGEIPAGHGEIWSSKNASRDKLLGSFLPYLFVGGEERGLTWFASNDRGWVVDETGKTSALTLERRAGVLTLRVRLIQKPTKLTAPRHITFGLLATPVKPMPDGWRRMGFDSGGETEIATLGMSMYWGADLYSVFPRKHDYTLLNAIAAAKKTGQSDRAFFDQWIKENPDFKNEVNWSANPGKFNKLIPYTNLRGEITSTPEWVVFQDEWRRNYFPEHRWNEPAKGSIDFATIPVPSRQDYLLWHYREILKAGFDGIYWDNIAIYDNESPVTGRGYFRPDGLWQTDTDIWEMRALTRRTALLFDELNKPNLTQPHMTNAYLLPVFSWTTLNLDWEWKYGGSDFQDRFTRPYIRATGIGRQGGNVPIALQGITEVRDAEQRKWVERTRIAAAIPHEINIWQADPLFRRIKQYFLKLDYGTEKCEVFNYWEKEPIIKVEGIDAAWLVLKSKNEVVIFLSDWGEGGTPKIELDTKRLGLPNSFTVKNWENTEQELSGQDGVLMLSCMKKHDFGMWIISTPQTSS